MVVLIAVVVAGLVAYLVLQRVREVFCVSVRNGRVLVVRGRIPQGLLNDFHAAVSNAPAVAWGSIRAVRTAEGARLQVSGVDEGREQRLRNVFHLYPVSRLRLAERPADRSLGQLLGIAWLAWLLQPRNPLDP